MLKCKVNFKPFSLRRSLINIMLGVCVILLVNRAWVSGCRFVLLDLVRDAARVPWRSILQTSVNNILLLLLKIKLDQLYKSIMKNVALKL